jgi:hypothetical protein
VLPLMMDAIFNIAAERFSAVHDASSISTSRTMSAQKINAQDGAQVILD